ncbi:MAG: mevalonate kinase, partial [Candidatus Pacebacteria bacterium]|nr:mevalonate kinase [Candidatus Paceibacterota bacterium]
MATASANGKTIFLGEHFSVYGTRIIGFGVNKKITVEALRSPTMAVEFGKDEKVILAIEAVKRYLNIDNFSARIIASEIPIGSGLGSSAALMVALVRAISGEFGLGLDDAGISAAAYEAEKIFHGAPSGIDNTLAACGGAVIFQKTALGPAVAQAGIGAPLHLVLIDTGIEKETLKMVGIVRKFKDGNEFEFAAINAEAGGLVNAAIENLQRGNTAKLGRLMDKNQELLARIGVSHPENDRVIELARRQGALGAKLVGAGGGGFCAALMESREAGENLVAALDGKYKSF